MPAGSHNLARFTPKRFEEFLVESANLLLEAEAVTRFLNRFSDFDLHNERVFSALFTKPSSGGVTYLLPNPGTEIAQKYPLLPSWDPHRVFSVDDTEGHGAIDLLQRLVIPYFRAVFRATWIEPDPQTRQWAWFMFRAELARIWDSSSEYLNLRLWDSTFNWLGEPERDVAVRLPQPPDEVPIERALRYLLSHHARARICPNEGCPAPYFFADRSSQRYCSESCAQNAEKETKRRWWQKNGPSWRQQRRQEACGSKLKKPRKPTKRSKTTGSLKSNRSRKKGR